MMLKYNITLLINISIWWTKNQYKGLASLSQMNIEAKFSTWIHIYLFEIPCILIVDLFHFTAGTKIKNTMFFLIISTVFQKCSYF